jgi:peptidyl-prolyl cis-trans isomerase A (cyclophilin A)
MLNRFVCVLLLGLCLAGSAFAKEGAKNPTLVLETSLGLVKVELFQKEAPVSVRNFLDYAKSGFYNGTVFHRVIPGFMIQGGGFTSDLTIKPTKAPIRNEAANGLKNERGTLAMARTDVVDSASSQFFINVANNGFLDHKEGGSAVFGYAVFGKVIAGMDVVDKIAATQTGVQKGFPDVPVTAVVIKSVKIVK